LVNGLQALLIDHGNAGSWLWMELNQGSRRTHIRRLTLVKEDAMFLIVALIFIVPFALIAIQPLLIDEQDIDLPLSQD
jgi:hypothetical protein